MWDVPLLDRKIDVRRIAEEKGFTPEEAGREVRYSLFREAAEKFGCGKIAVAQNMNDQAETVLMNLIRGAGTEGLKGMAFRRGDIYRPLLSISREEIERYCTNRQIEYVQDSTNFEPIYARNKIRLQLLPYIRENFNSAIADVLYRLSRMASEENELLEQMAKNALNKLRVPEADTGMNRAGRIKIQAAGLMDLHPALAKRVLRSAVREIAGDLKGIERKHIEAALKVAQQHTGSACQLPNWIRVEKSYGWLIIMKVVEIRQKRTAIDGMAVGGSEESPIRKDIEKKGQKCYHILVYGQNLLTDGTTVFIEKKGFDPVERLSGEPLTVFIDEEKIKNQLVARNRKEGDRFTPIGMMGSKKLKNFLIDRKVPKERRDDLLLICDGDEVVWIAGDVISEKYKLEKESRTALKIKIIQGD